MENNKSYIDKFYKKIADRDSLKDSEQSREIEKRIALSLGYTAEDLEIGANLGLGCGNPIENAHLKEGEVVLDLGSGKGIDVFKASRLVGNDGLAIGVDRLAEMTAKAESISQKKGITNTKFIQSDIDDLKIDDQSIDCVISNCVINLCDDKKKVYSEIYRVLKSGGRLSISDIVQFNKLPEQVITTPVFRAT